MRRQDIHPGREYLTREVRVTSIFPGLHLTRGRVRVEEPINPWGRFPVTWLMRDGSERLHHGLPRSLEPRRFLAEVPSDD